MKKGGEGVQRTDLSRATVPIAASSATERSICRLRPLRGCRAPGELAQRRVPNVLQISDADLARIESVASHFAEKRKEDDSLAQRCVFFRVLAISNQVQHLVALFRSTFHERFPVTVGAEAVQPNQSATQPQLELFV